MSYLYSPMGFVPEEREALTVTSEEIRAMPPALRMDYQLRDREAKARERAVFWDALATALPLAAALGLGALIGRK